jgi:hypothetical protein
MPLQHYRTNSVTEYKEFPERSHYTVGQDGWEEVADYALEWAVERAKRPLEPSLRSIHWSAWKVSSPKYESKILDIHSHTRFPEVLTL